MKNVLINTTYDFFVVAYDGLRQLGVPQGEVVWSTTIGTISSEGVFSSSTAGTGTLSATAAGITVTEDIEVFSTPRIMYDLNGADDGTAKNTQIVTIGQTAVLEKRLDLVKLGHKFLGWNTLPSGYGIHYDAGQSIVVTDLLVLYAEWGVATPNEFDHFVIYYNYAESGFFPINKNSSYATFQAVDAFNETYDLDMLGNIFIEATDIPAGQFSLDPYTGAVDLYLQNIPVEDLFSFTMKCGDFEETIQIQTYAQVATALSLDWFLGTDLYLYSHSSFNATVIDQHSFEISDPALLSSLSIVADEGDVVYSGGSYYYRPYSTTTTDRVVATLGALSDERSFSVHPITIDHLTISAISSVPVNSSVTANVYAISYTVNWWGSTYFLTPLALPLDETRTILWSTDGTGAFSAPTSSTTQYTETVAGSYTMSVSFGEFSTTKGISFYTPSLTSYNVPASQTSLSLAPGVQEGIRLTLFDQMGAYLNNDEWISEIILDGGASVIGHKQMLFYTAPATPGTYSITIGSLGSIPVTVVSSTIPTVSAATYSPLGRLGTTIPILVDADDEFEELSLPYPVKFNGTSYGSIFIGSNSYATFGSGSWVYQNLGTNIPPLNKILISAKDNYSINVYYWSTSSEWSIRYEGSTWTNESDTLIWEIRGNISSPDTIIVTIVDKLELDTGNGQPPPNTGAYFADGTKYTHFGNAGTAWSITSF